jgi:hypothetical protein
MAWRIFARWRPFDQDAVTRSAVPAPAREGDAAHRGGLASPRVPREPLRHDRVDLHLDLVIVAHESTIGRAETCRVKSPGLAARMAVMAFHLQAMTCQERLMGVF